MIYTNTLLNIYAYTCKCVNNGETRFHEKKVPANKTFKRNLKKRIIKKQYGVSCYRDVRPKQ